MEQPLHSLSSDLQHADVSTEKISCQSAPHADFTQYIGKALSVKVKLETDKQKKGKIIANVEGYSTGDAKVSISKARNDVYIVRFNPETPDVYTVIVKLNDKDVPHTPFVVNYIKRKTDPSKCKLIGSDKISHIPQLGKEIFFLVDASNAGPGELSVTADKPTETEIPSILNVSQKNGKTAQFEVIYTPNSLGYHHINVSWSGEPIPDSPMKFQVVNPEDAKMFSYGKPVAMDFETDGKDINMKVINKDTGAQIKGKLTKTSKGKYKATFLPMYPGLHYIHIYAKDNEISSSPYVIRYARPSKPEECKVFGLKETYFLDNEVTFIVDAKEAGDGELQVSVFGPNKSSIRKVRTADNKDGTYSIVFIPEHTGDHKIDVLWSDKVVPGCPFLTKVRDNDKKQLITKFFLMNRIGTCIPIQYPNGEDVLKSTTDQTLVITVKTFTDVQKNGKLVATAIKADTGENVPIQNTMQNNTFQVLFLPPSQGHYTISVQFNGQQISGMPFPVEYTIPCPVASQCKIIGLDNSFSTFQVDKMISFQVDTRLAGDGKISIQGETPRGKPRMKGKSSSFNKRIIDVMYTPNVAGTHKIKISWSGEEIPKSPLVFKVEPTPVFPYGKPIGFDLDVDAKEKYLHCLVFHEESGDHIKAKIKKLKKNKYTVGFKPTVPGLYSINIYVKMREIKNSPFIISYSSPYKHDTMEVHNAPKKVYMQELDISTVDAKDAGMSQPNVKNSPPEKGQDKEHGSNIVAISNINKMQLRQEDEICVTSSCVTDALPLQDKVGKPQVLSRAEKTISIGKSAFVDIGVKNIPQGALKVQQSGEGKASVQFKRKNEDIIECTVTPTNLGTCSLKFTFNDENIEGSPCTLDIYGISGIELKNETFEVGVLYKFMVRCALIHDGILNIFCNGGDSAADITTSYSNDEQAYNCSILPKEAGPNTISIQYNGYNLIGSPFNVVFDEPPPSKMSITLVTPTEMEQSGMSANIQTVSAEHSIPVDLNLLLHGQYNLNFVPTDELDYQLTIKCHLKLKELQGHFSLKTDPFCESSGVLQGESHKRSNI